MRKLLLLLIISLPVIAYSQNTITIGTGFNRAKVANDFQVTGVTYLGVKDTTFTPTQTGAFVIRPQDNLPYYFISRSGQRWFPVQMGTPIFSGTGSGVNFQIGIGSTTSIPNASSVSAGVIDTARIRYIDSLRSGLKKSSIVIGHPGAGKWTGYPSTAGDSLYLKNITNGKYTFVITNTDSSNETDVDTASLRTLFNAAYLPLGNTVTINGTSKNLSTNPSFTVNSGSGAVKQIVTQSNTGLAVNMPVYVNSSGVWAPADTTNFAEAVVDSLISTTGFELTFDGIYHAASHGLTVGSYYYVTEPAGVISTTSPNKSQPVLVPIDANDVLVRLYRPNNFGLPLSPFIDTSGVINGEIPQWSTSLGHFIMSQPSTLIAGPGLIAYGGDSISWGSNPFNAPITTNTAGFAWTIAGLPNKSPGAGDSALLMSSSNQLYKTVNTSASTGTFTASVITAGAPSVTPAVGSSWIRVGNTVFVYGEFSFSSSSSTVVTTVLSVPIASAMSVGPPIGMATVTYGSPISSFGAGDVSTSSTNVAITYTTTTSGGGFVIYSYSYQVN